MRYAAEIKEKIWSDSYSTPIKAVIYARVSTDNEGQKESCANQVALAKSFIANHPNIELVEVFVDDGISAKNDYTRPEYTKLLNLLETGEIDLIIAKTNSRLVRSQRLAQEIKDLMVEHNATLFTLETSKVWDFEDMNDIFLFTMVSYMDEQYSVRQREAMLIYQRQRKEAKKLASKDVVFGYNWNPTSKKIEINEEQSQIIVNIFEEYVYKNRTPAEICDQLSEQGYTYPCVRIDKDTKEKYLMKKAITEKQVSTILSNEKYIGRFYIGKTTTSPGSSKTKSKKIKLPKEEWELVDVPELQIVDQDLFQIAQMVRQNRQNIYIKPDREITQAYFRGRYMFSGIVFCACCGRAFQYGHADRRKTIPEYRIRKHKGCPDPAKKIPEKELEAILKKALRSAIRNQSQACKNLERVLADSIRESLASQDQTNNLLKEKKDKEKLIDNLISELTESELSDSLKARIREKLNSVENEAKNLDVQIEAAQKTKIDDDYIKNKIISVKKAIQDLKSFKKIDRERILNYVERIEIQSNGDINILLKEGQEMMLKSNDINLDSNVVKMSVKGAPYSLPTENPAPLRP